MKREEKEEKEFKKRGLLKARGKRAIKSGRKSLGGPGLNEIFKSPGDHWGKNRAHDFPRG